MKEIKVLGPGCAKCEELLARTKQAVEELKLEGTVEKVTDINEITAHGIMMTPALIVNGQIKLMGKVPQLDELKQLLG